MAQNGKGDAPRQTQNQDAYSDAWDRIFKGNNTSVPTTRCRTCGITTDTWDKETGDCMNCVEIRRGGREAQ